MGTTSSSLSWTPPPSTATSHSTHLTTDLPSLILDSPLGGGRFMKTFRCRAPRDGGTFVVKVYLNRGVITNNTTPNGATTDDPDLTTLTIEDGEGGEGGSDDAIEAERVRMNEIYKLLSDPVTDENGPNKTFLSHPNVLPYQMYFTSATTGRDRSGIIQPIYLIRQNFTCSLADRLATRPFLTPVEKDFIAFQLLEALDHLHASTDTPLCHGDIKAENVMITSFNFVVLTDFASFKPTTLPINDPSKFNYFFHTPTESSSTKPKKCYVAPERFVDSDLKTNAASENAVLTPPHDIFSTGCVFIEMYLNGEVVFDLPSLLRYRIEQTLTPALLQKLNKIERTSIRNVCEHMLNLTPSKRKSAAAYRTRLETPDESPASSTSPAPPVFPPAFKDFLYPLMKRLRHDVLTPDSRIALVTKHYAEGVLALTGFQDDEGGKFFETILGPSSSAPPVPPAPPSPSSLPPPPPLDSPLPPAPPRSLSITVPPPPPLPPTPQQLQWEELLKETNELLAAVENNEYNPPKDLAETPPKPSLPSAANQLPPPPPATAPSSSLLLLLQIILSSVRHTTRPSSKIVGMHLITRLAHFTDDETRLQRLVPYVVSLLDDPIPSIRATALRLLCHLLTLITTFPPSDAKLFPQYIFKHVGKLADDEELVVRTSFAEAIVVVAEAAKRFLDVSQAMKMYKIIQDEEDGTENTPMENTYDSELQTLHTMIKAWFNDIIRRPDPDSQFPKRALLHDLSRLCAFFGHDRVEEEVMPALITFHVDPNWVLRAAFCLHIPAACAFVGRVATEQFVVPCIENALIDVEEKVVAKAIGALTSLATMGLLNRHTLLGCTSPPHQGILEKYSALLLHPSPAVRSSTMELIVAAQKIVGSPDDAVFILPLVRPFLKFEPSKTQLASVEAFEECVLSSISRRGFRNELLRLSELRKFSRMRAQQRVEVSARSDESNMGGAGSAGDESLRDILDAVGLDSAIVEGKEGGADALPAQAEDAPYSPPSPAPTTPAATTTTPFDPDEQTRLQQMHVYLEMASTHMMNKMNSYENEKKQNNRRNLQRQDTQNWESLQSIAGDAMFDVQKVPADFVQPLWIPSQKFTELFPGGNRVAEPLPLSQHKDVESIINSYGLKGNFEKNSSGTRKWGNLESADFSFGEEGESQGEEADGSSQDFTGDGSDPSGVSAANIEGILNGEWGAIANQDLTTTELTNLAIQIQALEIPPLGPKLGVLRNEQGRAFSWYAPEATLPVSATAASDSQRRNDWRPKSDCLIASSSPVSEHTAAVCRLAVAQDQSFFVSASHDGTSKVWELRGLESAVDLKSVLTYHGQEKNRVNDVTMLENSHSVATAGSDGSAHVWRIDMVGGYSTGDADGGGGVDASKRVYYETGRVRGSSVIKTFDPAEGEALCISHFNSDDSSMLMCGTQGGVVHAWDLRSSTEPYALKLRPELGFLSSMAMGTDRNWMVCGTSRGFIGLWDVRYQTLVKLWHHSSSSPIHRLATCHTRLPQDTGRGDAVRPYIFVAAGKNEASVFDVAAGDCRQCFRTLGAEYAGLGRGGLSDELLELPSLKDISLPSRPDGCIEYARNMASDLSIGGGLGPEPSMRALMGRISDSGASYLVSGGSDRRISFWDFQSASRCYTISGDKLSSSSVSKNLFLGIPNVAKPSSNNINPLMMKGGVRPQAGHEDSVLDLKSVERPRALLSAGGDGIVKCWR